MKLKHLINLYFQILVQKTRYIKLYHKIDLISVNDLIDKINNDYNNTCHIIGSGSSVLKSKKLIHPGDFVIGINFSCILDLNYNLYFVEFGGENCLELTIKQKKLIDNKLNKDALVVFKNILDKKNDIKTINKIYKNNTLFIKDIILTALSFKELKLFLKYMLNTKSNFLYQYSSSVVTAILLASKANFNKIILHGVDFGGDNFYENKLFNDLKSYFPYDSKYYIKKNKIHSTDNKIGIKDSLKILNDLLNNKDNTRLYSNEFSKSNTILPIYKI